MSAPVNKSVQWPQVWSLIALDVAIIISWVAYHEYQIELIAQFGFTQQALQLIIIQGIIVFATPPIAGYLADRVRARKGERLPIINIGITVASMIFMAAAATIYANPSGLLRYLFPLLVVLWLISMNIFHSPAISSLELFVSKKRLPEVMVLFAILADCAQALEPSIVDLIRLFGAPLTFVVGGVLVFTTGWYFRKITQGVEVQHRTTETESSSQQSNTAFFKVIALGMVLGVTTAFFFEVFPAWAKAKLTFMGFSSNYMVTVLLVVAAVLAYPASLLVKRFGNVPTAVAGAVLSLVLIVLIYLSTGYIAFVGFVLYPAAFSIMSVSFLPLVFQFIGSRHKVLGVGLFFSAVELPNSVAKVLATMGQL